MQDRITLNGRFRGELYGPDGRLLQAAESRNTIILAARALIPEILQNGNANVGTVIEKLGVGTGRTAPTQTDTDLETSLLKKAINTSTGFDNTNLVNDPPEFSIGVQFDAAEAIGNVSEAAVFFDDLSMLARALFGQGSITGATQANPVVITSASHGLLAGEEVYIESVGGMTEINNRVFTVANPATDTFELSGEDGTGHSAYTSGGTWTKVFPKTASDILVVTYTLTT